MRNLITLLSFLILGIQAFPQKNPGIDNSQKKNQNTTVNNQNLNKQDQKQDTVKREQQKQDTLKGGSDKVDTKITPGASGVKRSIGYKFSTGITDNDPGNGLFRYNKNTVSDVSYIYVDNIDISGEDQTKWYKTWDDSTGATGRGQINIVEYEGKNVDIFSVTDVFTEVNGYWKIPVQYVSGNLPADGSVYYYVFNRIENKKVSDEKDKDKIIVEEVEKVEEVVEVEVSKPPVEPVIIKVEETRPPVDSVIVKVEETKPPIDTVVVKVEETTQPVEPVIVTVEEARPPVEPVIVTVEETKPPVEPVIVTVEETKPPVDSVIVTVEETKPPEEPVIVKVEETKPPVEPVIVTVEETKPPVDSVIVTVEETKPPAEPVIVKVEETKPPVEPVVVKVEETKPPVEPVVTKVEELKPPAEPVKEETARRSQVGKGTQVTQRNQGTRITQPTQPAEPTSTTQRTTTSQTAQKPTSQTKTITTPTTQTTQPSPPTRTTQTTTSTTQKTTTSSTTSTTSTTSTISTTKTTSTAPTTSKTQTSQGTQIKQTSQGTQGPPVYQRMTAPQTNELSASGSRHGKCYRGIIELGYGFRVSEYGMNNFRFNFINGFNIRNTSIGLGIGIRKFYEKPDKHPDWYLVSDDIQIPVFIDIRTHFSSKKITPYLSLGIGDSEGFGGSGEKKPEGLFFNTSGGIWFNITDRFALFGGIAYELQRLEYANFSDNIPYKEYTNSISLNIGIAF